MTNFFVQFARKTAELVGSAWIFFTAILIVIVWIVTGPFFHFSDTWQLVINTTSSVVTFLIVFIIQNTQNRDTAALQIKLDELIRSNKRASNTLINLEDLTDEQLKELEENYKEICKKAILAKNTAQKT